MIRHGKLSKGTVTSPQGFSAAGIHCGLKKDKKDFGIIFSKNRSAAAGVFTKNQLKAAPVTFSQKQLDLPRAHAIILNSGIANACTGHQGIRDARYMCDLAAKHLGIEKQDVLVASTGVIGEYLPMSIVEQGIMMASSRLSRHGGLDAANAIMTTDTVPKHFNIEFELDQKSCQIGAIAKGSGMIQPNMATMLCMLTTDIDIDPPLLYKALAKSCQSTLNALTIDGETSTNDCVFILANGNAGNELIKNKGHSYQVFQANLETICRAITIELARDGEGATKVITVNVEQAYNTDQAYIAARAIANSPLVKTAIYGQDPNWGRVISAVGACDINLNIAEIKVGFGGIPVVDGGRAIDYDKHEMKTALAKQDIQIDMILGSGQANATVYTCDLTHEYITINAEYHT